MDKNLDQRFVFDISNNSDFDRLAEIFGNALEAVEKQGYSVEYGAETLFQPGRIGVIGPPACGKSTFFNKAVAHLLQNCEILEKCVPSFDRARDVQVWKRWLSRDGQREIRIEDSQATEALSHEPDILLPDIKSHGVVIHEHPSEPESYCDMILKFSYNDGKRFLEIRTSQNVVDQQSFRTNFLTQVEELSLA